MCSGYRSVVYLLSGKPHLPYLVASLYSLRKHWEGEVEIHAWSESFPIVQRIRDDERLGVFCEEREPALRKKDGNIGNNSQFLDKIKLAQSLQDEVDSLLYLDCDTTIHGDVTPLFESAEASGFRVTQWNDWVTTGRIIGGRIRRLRDIEEIDQSFVDDLLLNKFPSINGGVWACLPESLVLPLWYDWTLAACPMFIADESVLHVMMAKFYPHDLSMDLDNGKYNSSPKHFHGIEAEKVRIWHYHGDCNVRPQKSKFGYELWWPIYQECLRLNLGGIKDWIGEVGNKWLTKEGELK